MTFALALYCFRRHRTQVHSDHTCPPSAYRSAPRRGLLDKAAFPRSSQLQSQADSIAFYSHGSMFSILSRLSIFQVCVIPQLYLTHSLQYAATLDWGLQAPVVGLCRAYAVTGIASRF